MGRGRSAVAVRASGLTKEYGGRVVVDHLDLEAEPGRVTGFLGPNGSGKSTTLRMLLGLVRPTAGTATIGGRPYPALSRPTGTVGALLATGQFHPGRSGRDHLLVLAAVEGVPPARVDEVLEVVALAGAGRSRVRTYSLGMRQRLGLAAALLGDPDVLVLDEPANGLDPAGMRWLRGLLRGFAAEGGTVLVSSHLLDEVAQVADEVVVIARGRQVARGSVADLAGAERRLEDVFLELTDDGSTSTGLAAAGLVAARAATTGTAATDEGGRS